MGAAGLEPGKQPVCYLKGASKHLRFGFWHGASSDDVHEPLFAYWLRQARELEAAES